MRLILCALAMALLAGCVTNEQGKKQFNPWKAAKNADQQFDEWWYNSQ